MGAQTLDTSVLPTDHPKLGGGEEGSAEAPREGQAAVAGGTGEVLGRLPRSTGTHHSRSCVSTQSPWFRFCVGAGSWGVRGVPSSRARSFRKAQQGIRSNPLGLPGGFHSLQKAGGWVFSCGQPGGARAGPCQTLLLPDRGHKGTSQRTKASMLRIQSRRKRLGLVDVPEPRNWS